MRTLLRDRKIIYYANPTGTADQTDVYGNITGVLSVAYGDPVKYDRLSAENPKGYVKLETFGLSEAYNITLVTHDMNCPVTSESHIWMNKAPYDGEGNLVPHTHVVKRIWKTTNAVRIEFEEVSVS